MTYAFQFETRASTTGLFILAGTARPWPWREWLAVFNGRTYHAVTSTATTLERSPLVPQSITTHILRILFIHIRACSFSTGRARFCTNRPLRTAQAHHPQSEGQPPLSSKFSLRRITSIYHPQLHPWRPHIPTPINTDASKQAAWPRVTLHCRHWARTTTVAHRPEATT